MSQKNDLYGYINTRFSNNFSDKKWRTIAVGQSKGDVIQLLGQPLDSLKVKGDSCYYPKSASMRYDFSGAKKVTNPFSGYAYCTFSVVVDTSMRVVSKHVFWDED